MKIKFEIGPKIADDHRRLSGPNEQYNKTHPHLYRATQCHGHPIEIISPRGNFQRGDIVELEGKFIDMAGFTYFADHTPQQLKPANDPKATSGETIASEVQVSLLGLTQRGDETIVEGELFYVPPNATKKSSPALQAAFKEKSRITIVTNAPHNDLVHCQINLKQAFGFAGLDDVRVSGAVQGVPTLIARHRVVRYEAPDIRDFLN